MTFDFISLLAGLLGLIPLVVYFLHWRFYSPKPFVRVSGEQSGDPIQIPEKGKIFFGVCTKSSCKSVLCEVWVSFNPDEVNLLKTRGAEQRVTVDNKYPLALLFPEKRIIAKRHFQGNYFDYEAINPEFSVKFIIDSEIETTELPFLLNMFPSRKLRTSRVVRFKVTQGYTTDPKKDGLRLLPKESIHIEGIQSQEGVYAATSKGVGSLKVIELIDDEKS